MLTIKKYPPRAINTVPMALDSTVFDSATPNAIRINAKMNARLYVGVVMMDLLSVQSMYAKYETKSMTHIICIADHGPFQTEMPDIQDAGHFDIL